PIDAVSAARDRRRPPDTDRPARTGEAEPHARRRRSPRRRVPRPAFGVRTPCLARRADRAAGPDSIHVTGLDAGPLEENLVLRAIAAARTAIGQGPGRPRTPPLAVRLE